jgi:hypothetical protein
VRLELETARQVVNLEFGAQIMHFKSSHGFIRSESTANRTATSQTIPFGEDLMISSTVLKVLEVHKMNSSVLNHILMGEAKF